MKTRIIKYFVLAAFLFLTSALGAQTISVNRVSVKRAISEVEAKTGYSLQGYQIHEGSGGHGNSYKVCHEAHRSKIQRSNQAGRIRLQSDKGGEVNAGTGTECYGHSGT